MESLASDAAPTGAAAQLLAEGAALDAASAPPQLDAAGQPVAPPDFAGEARMILDTAAGIAGQFYPSVTRTWTPDRKAAVAGVLAPVLEKYGWTLGDFMGAWKEEVALLMVAGPIVLETVDGIKADRAAARKAAAEPRPAGSPAPVLDPAALG